MFKIESLKVEKGIKIPDLKAKKKMEKPRSIGYQIVSKLKNLMDSVAIPVSEKKIIQSILNAGPVLGIQLKCRNMMDGNIKVLRVWNAGSKKYRRTSKTAQKKMATSPHLNRQELDMRIVPMGRFKWKAMQKGLKQGLIFERKISGKPVKCAQNMVYQGKKRTGMKLKAKITGQNIHIWSPEHVVKA